MHILNLNLQKRKYEIYKKFELDQIIFYILITLGFYLTYTPPSMNSL